MPNFNGQGPRGEGSMTGRGMGSCNGQGYGRQGCGRGFGFRRFFSQKEAGPRQAAGLAREVVDLKAYQEDLKAELKAIEEQLKENK